MKLKVSKLVIKQLSAALVLSCLCAHTVAASNTLNVNLSMGSPLSTSLKSLSNSPDQKFQSSITEINWAQNENANLRSRNEVVREIKDNYENVRVLKISYSERHKTYRVRVLMPNGTIKSIQVDARRRNY